MNERIKELVKQATSYTWNGDGVTEDLDEEEFVQLLFLDLIKGINNIQTANKCVYTTFDKSIADCVKTEIIKLIETTYNVKVPYANS